MSSSTQGNTVHLRESEGWTVFRTKKKLPLPLLFDFSGHRFLISYTPLVLKLKDFSDQAEVLEQIYLPGSSAPFSRQVSCHESEFSREKNGATYQLSIPIASSYQLL
jgi:hypothetical protein